MAPAFSRYIVTSLTPASNSENYLYKLTRVVSTCFVLTHMYQREISRTSSNLELLQTKYVNYEVRVIEPLKRKMHLVGIGSNFYFL